MDPTGQCVQNVQRSLLGGNHSVRCRRKCFLLAGKDFEEIRKNKGGEEIINEIEEKFDGNLGAFLQFLAEQRTKLAAVAEQAQLLENPSGTTTDPEPTSIDQLEEQYKAAVRRQQQSLDDQRAELIENEFDREREAIRLNYEKNRQEYERQEQQTLALIRKLRESGPISIRMQRKPLWLARPLQ